MELPEPYVTRAQLATRLGVSVRTVDRLVADGAPSEQWGLRARRFRVSEVTEWVRSRELRVGPAASGDLAVEPGFAEGKLLDAAPHDDEGLDVGGVREPLEHEAPATLVTAPDVVFSLADEAARWQCSCGVCQRLLRITSSRLVIGGPTRHISLEPQDRSRVGGRRYAEHRVAELKLVDLMSDDRIDGNRGYAPEGVALDDSAKRG